MVQEAEGFRESQVARARGEAQRFLSVLSAYQVAQDVTLRRLYIETMEEVFRRNPKIVVDSALQGIVPLLNLSDPARAGAAAGAAAQRPLPQAQPSFQTAPPPAAPPRSMNQGIAR